ncbi:hypothetical protein [Arsenicicoccus dermatophilus]|uniref:hypothetical protein n=1 Tax=Arsenicicoccus dermatophilus TaxID=1076331 RepID=UPI0039170EB8
MTTPATFVPPVLERHSVPDKCPGALRMFQASDGKIARVRLAGSPLTAEQAEAIGELADTLGDGQVLFTTRANVQLRGLDDEGSQTFATRVAELGLLPSTTHERTRNVVVSPLTGLGDGHPDVVPVARALDAAIQASPALAGLAGRFLVGLDDGDGFLAALPLDLTAQVRGDELVCALGTHEDDQVYAVGALAEPAAVAGLLARICETWLEVKAARGEEVWNIDDLSAAGRAELHERVGRLTDRAEGRVERATRQPRLAAVVAEQADGTVTVAAKAPLAAIGSPGWRLAAAVARGAADQIRVTPWHAIVVPGVAADRAPEVLTALAEAGWAVDPASPWLDVHACTGLPQCARSHADVQEHARALVDAQHGALAGLPVMLSGCGRQCGHPATPHHAFVAQGTEDYSTFLHDGSHEPQESPVREMVSPGQIHALITTTGSNA